MADPQNDEIKVTVDGGQFYTFARAMKRAYTPSRLGEVILAVRGERLIIETMRGGSLLACTPAPPVTARILGGNFLNLVHLASDAQATGPLTIVFRPTLGEIGLPHIGTKAKFDQPA